ncbi:hypothetical protein D9601_03450 [Sphingomonas sp. MA1305]|uniref:hypothetical protein n=1 Tax=Sphingomonas sp. MA1305 TaxID=2479204 RepID=UPI0018DFD8F7|nr:hypothetical protein [Sphingomonas sp. MA1305]MBI0474420.1 hypothetical protein [Sphingomonas sp. MA1305]
MLSEADHLREQAARYRDLAKGFAGTGIAATLIQMAEELEARCAVIESRLRVDLAQPDAPTI